MAKWFRVEQKQEIKTIPSSMKNEKLNWMRANVFVSASVVYYIFIFFSHDKFNKTMSCYCCGCYLIFLLIFT